MCQPLIRRYTVHTAAESCQSALSLHVVIFAAWRSYLGKPPLAVDFRFVAEGVPNFEAKQHNNRSVKVRKKKYGSVT